MEVPDLTSTETTDDLRLSIDIVRIIVMNNNLDGALVILLINRIQLLQKERFIRIVERKQYRNKFHDYLKPIKFSRKEYPLHLKVKRP